MGYITNFIVYTLAMVGVLVVALLVFKNSISIGGGRSSKYLKIIDSISLGQRKYLYIVSTGKEQFLIAGDVNNTSLISKINLGNNGNSANSETLEKVNNIENIPVYNFQNIETENQKKYSSNSFQDTLTALSQKKYTDRTQIGIQSSLISKKQNSSGSVIQNIADILKK